MHMAQSNEEPKAAEDNDPLNDSWFDRPGRSLTPVPFPSERPSYDYADTHPSDVDLDDAWFL